MIIEYNRPESMEETIDLLSRDEPHTIVLGGGLFINEVLKEQVAVADIQNLGLNRVEKKGKELFMGAGATLQDLLIHNKVPPVVKGAIKYQENYNRRQMATLAGTLIIATGRSAIATVMLALDAELHLIGRSKKEKKLLLGDFLPLRKEKLNGNLVTQIVIPANTSSAFHYVARSPSDLPIVAVGVSQWPSGRTRVVLAGFGNQPIMVLDGPNADGATAAAEDAYSEAGDQWASAEYRAKTAAVLVNRSLGEIAQMREGN
jgi:CO/xanthine dehydrogenase FAD-binding subunit